MVFLVSRPREPIFHLPAVVGWLIACLVAVHLVRLVLPPALDQDILFRFAFTPMRYAPGIDGGGPLAMALPFVGHIFLHADFFHLGMNCLWLLTCGAVVARRYGPFAFLVFFLLCGIAGAGAFLADNWGQPDLVIGASGAVSGLMAASIRMIPWFGRYANYGPPGRPLVPLFSKPVLVFTALWVFTNLIFEVIGFAPMGQVHTVAWQAHLGGFACGLVLSSLFEAVSARRISG